MRKGFTLIELIIVIIVIGILATVAIPQYTKAIERAKAGKARHALGLIAQAEKMYRAEMDTYVNVADGAFDSDLGTYVELKEIDADTDWDYDVSGADADAFLATATRKAGPADIKGTTFTLDQDGVWDGTHPFAPK